MYTLLLVCHGWLVSADLKAQTVRGAAGGILLLPCVHSISPSSGPGRLGVPECFTARGQPPVAPSKRPLFVLQVTSQRRSVQRTCRISLSNLTLTEPPCPCLLVSCSRAPLTSRGKSGALAALRSGTDSTHHLPGAGAPQSRHFVHTLGKWRTEGTGRRMPAGSQGS